MNRVKTSLVLLCILIFASYMQVAIAGEKAAHIKPEREVLTQAAELGFDYFGNLRRAETGEIGAAVALIDFSTQTDAAAALAHGWVLLDLQKIIGTRKFRVCLARASGKGRRSSLRIMEIARTYK